MQAKYFISKLNASQDMLVSNFISNIIYIIYLIYFVSFFFFLASINERIVHMYKSIIIIIIIINNFV